MRLLFCFLLCSMPLIATTLCVGTPPASPQCGITFVNSALQQALDAAHPGDTIYLQAGYRYSGTYMLRVHGDLNNPITVTSSKYAWLPGPFSRLTPSDLPNLPILSTNSINVPVLAGYLDSSGNPPQGWNIVGVGFEMDTTAEFDNSLVLTGGTGYAPISGGTPWYISGPTNAPNGLTFDRIFVASRFDDSQATQTLVSLHGSNIVMKNSFLWPPYGAGIENHGVLVLTGPGPLTMANNFISGMSIPYLFGGSGPDYVGGNPANVTLSYSYMVRPYKWWANTWDSTLNSGSGAPCVLGTGSCYTTANPYPQDFLTNGSKYGCQKNEGEYKTVDGVMQEYNVHETNWMDGYCLGQWFGMTITMRQTAWPSLNLGGTGKSYWMGTLVTQGTHMSWNAPINPDYPNNTWLQAGQKVCSYSCTGTPTGSQAGPCNTGASPPIYDCRRLTSVTINSRDGSIANTGTIDHAFSPDLNTNQWVWVEDPDATLSNVVIQNSIFRNVAGGMNILAKDRYGWDSAAVAPAGRISHLQISNLLFQDTFVQPHNLFGKIYPQEAINTNADLQSGDNITIEHVTFDWTSPSYNVWFFVGEGILDSALSKIANLNIRSNIFPQALNVGSENSPAYYALQASGGFFNNWAYGQPYVSGTSAFSYNQFPNVVGSGCLTVDCSGDLSASNASSIQYAPGTYTLLPNSPLWNAGYEGTNIGVNPALLPMIQNLTVTPSAKTALLNFNLSGPIQDANNTEPCVLEVSTSETLRSYVSALPSTVPYTTISDLNPVYFKQATASSRSNPLLPSISVSGGHVQWSLGLDATVTGDDGASHYLGLAPVTQYWGRLMCYGDAQQFTFTTSSLPSGSTSGGSHGSR